MTHIFRKLMAPVALIAAFAAGSWVGRTGENGTQALAERQSTAYSCPMHPDYRSAGPGTCPQCGMRLVPVSAGSSDGDAAPPRGANLLQVDQARQQQLGVRIGSAEISSTPRAIRAFGTVVPEERRTYRINAAVDGRIEEVGAVSTGAIVDRGQRLGSFSAPEFYSAERTYIFAIQTRQRYSKNGETAEHLATADLGVRQAAAALRNLGMSDVQLEDITRRLEPDDRIWIVAPARGIVLSHAVYPARRFDRGAELLTVADLSRVWVLTDLYENQAGSVAPGSPATVSLPVSDRSFRARVSDVPPLFDGASRTLRLRVEVDNPGRVLEPGMSVNVEVPVASSPALTLPDDAVVDTGDRRVVFVDRGRGYFELRRVETGWRANGRVQIVSGLAAGEAVALSGTFLLDSEARLRLPAPAVKVF